MIQVIPPSQLDRQHPFALEETTVSYPSLYYIQNIWSSIHHYQMFSELQGE